MRQDDAASPLGIRLLGPFEVRLAGQPLPRLGFRKSQPLLAWLALRDGREVERGGLAGLLWPDATQSAALHSLRNCLTDLRHALGPEAARLRSPTPRTLCLELTGAFVDVLAFDAAIARGDRTSLAEAVTLYRGPLLEGCTEEWAFQERQAREQAYLAALEKLAADALAAGDWSTVEAYLRQAAAVDPLRESTQRALMEALAAGGNYAGALLCYRELRLRLHRELNAEPDPETQALFEQLRAEARKKAAARRSPSLAGDWSTSRVPTRAGNGKDPDVRLTASELSTTPRHLEGDGSRQLREESPGARRRAAAPPQTLPLQLTSFIGRQTEMAQLQQQLAAHRLVTLTGAGGCGKTRLALEAATGLLSTYPDGVWFVGLAALADPALVPQTVAAVLGIREQPDRAATQTLTDALTPEQLLLVLDNCEHLVEACARLTETLLQTCPQLCVLATSREPLGIDGERTYRVPSLSLPDPRQWLMDGGRCLMADGRPPPHQPSTINPRPSTLLRYEAVKLFVERAVTAQPAFAVTPENAAAVAQVCCRLDGIPLALELAAARLKALPLETLNERLTDMFGLLTGGRRTALPRHQTLQALIDWSYDLLTPPEQALLRRLSVFAGGWTLEAAEAICGDCGFGNTDVATQSGQSTPCSIRTPHSAIRNEEVLDLLTRLVEKSLVLYEERKGEGCYRMLEMIREYAREQLTAAGEAEALRERHARFFLALSETAACELTRADPAPWLDRLEREHDNLRAALAWSTEKGQMEIGLRLGSALEQFWEQRGHLKEGRDQLLRLLAQPGAAAPTLARARALSSAGRFAELQHNLGASKSMQEESMAIGRALNDGVVIATALLHLGRLALYRWDVTTARPLVEEAVAIRRELGDPRTIARALLDLAEVRRHERDLPAARALVEESLAIWRALGDRAQISSALGSLGEEICFQGDPETARPLIEEALEGARDLDDRIGIAWGITRLGYVAHMQEDYPSARAYFEQSLPLWRELDHKRGLQQALFQLAFMRQQQGDYAAAYALREELHVLMRDWMQYTGLSCLGLLADSAADLGRWEEAAARCAESLRCWPPRERGSQANIATALTVMARVALARGRAARAARLLAASPALVQPAVPRWPHRRAHFDRIVSAVRAQLEETEFAAAWAEGEALPVEQIIAEALQEAPGG